VFLNQNLKRVKWLALFSAVVLASGCPKSPVDPAPVPPAQSDAGAPVGESVTASSRNNLKFKGGQRYAAELAEALSLEPNEVCNELSAYDCVNDVHNISLAGVEPYRLVVYKPVPDRSVASVNAIDRIALSACEARVQKDFADPASATVFAEMTAATVTAAGAREVGKRLFEQLLHREASAQELDALASFQGELTSSGQNAQRLSTLSCFTIASSEEALFY
jgi:hypothetical protein